MTYTVANKQKLTLFVARLRSCSSKHMICALFPLAAVRSHSFSNGSSYKLNKYTLHYDHVRTRKNKVRYKSTSSRHIKNCINIIIVCINANLHVRMVLPLSHTLKEKKSIISTYSKLIIQLHKFVHISWN